MRWQPFWRPRGAFAQNSTEAHNEREQKIAQIKAEQAKRAEELQRKLEAQANKIRRERSAREASADAPVAKLRRLKPDWAAVRRDLQATARRDQERFSRSTNFTAAVTPPTPPTREGLRVAASSVKEKMRAEIERVRVPLLLPNHPDVQDKFKIYGMRNIYSAFAQIDPKAALSITGTCARVVGGDPKTIRPTQPPCQRQ